MINEKEIEIQTELIKLTFINLIKKYTINKVITTLYNLKNSEDSVLKSILQTLLNKVDYFTLTSCLYEYAPFQLSMKFDHKSKIIEQYIHQKRKRAENSYKNDETIESNEKKIIKYQTIKSKINSDLASKVKDLNKENIFFIINSNKILKNKDILNHINYTETSTIKENEKNNALISNIIYKENNQIYFLEIFNIKHNFLELRCNDKYCKAYAQYNLVSKELEILINHTKKYENHDLTFQKSDWYFPIKSFLFENSEIKGIELIKLRNVNFIMKDFIKKIKCIELEGVEFINIENIFDKNIIVNNERFSLNQKINEKNEINNIQIKKSNSTEKNDNKNEEKKHSFENVLKLFWNQNKEISKGLNILDNLLEKNKEINEDLNKSFSFEENDVCK